MERHPPTLAQTLESAAQAYLETLPHFSDAQRTLREKLLVEAAEEPLLLPETLRQLASLSQTAGLALASVKVHSLTESGAGWALQLEVMGHPIDRKQ